MSIIQDEFRKNPGDFTLTPGEYEGPLIIDRPCVVNGQNSTIWSNSGPVVIVDSPSVVLKNLRIEVTGIRDDDQTGVSLKLNHHDTGLENVEVNGIVKGLADEARAWSIPDVIALGDFAANKENSFSIEFDAPRDAEIVHNIKDVVIRPQRVKAGRNSLYITTSDLRDNTILFGEMLIKTSVSRRIYITGKAKNGAPEHTAEPPVSGEISISPPLQIAPPDEVVAPVINDELIEPVRRGQRSPLNHMQSQTIKMVYSHKGTRCRLTVDPYVFLLGKNGKVRSDNDLIFFGNEESESKDVRVKTDSGSAFASIELSKTAADVEKIAVCMSIYEDEQNSSFACVDEPMLRVFADSKEQFRFMLDGLKEEKTVVAAELYRYKGEWKINFIGGGFKLGLAALCREYGVDVE